MIGDMSDSINNYTPYTYTMRSFYFLLLLLCTLNVNAQLNCCDDANCRNQSQKLAGEVIPLLQFIGEGSSDAATNKKSLEKAFQTDPIRYQSFRSLIYEVVRFADDQSHDQCIKTFLSSQQYINLHRWMAYFNDIANPVSFPSPEFCEGFRTRLEIGQGAADVMTSTMAYFGSVKGFISYTFGKKESCGNHLRLLAGPALLLQNRSAYAALSTRLGYRIKDIMIKNPPVFLGNWNLFGEYSTNFQKFSYAGIGAEAQLGRFGVNVMVNRGFESERYGFVFGIFIGNRKKK